MVRHQSHVYRRQGRPEALGRDHSNLGGDLVHVADTARGLETELPQDAVDHVREGRGQHGAAVGTGSNAFHEATGRRQMKREPVPESSLAQGGLRFCG